MLSAVIRRKAFLMDEIKNPLKVVSLIGDAKEVLPLSKGEDEFRGLALKGVFYAFVCYIFLAVFFGLCVGMAGMIQRGIHWIMK